MKLESGDTVEINGTTYVISLLQFDSRVNGKTIKVQLVEEDLYDEIYLETKAEDRNRIYERMEQEFLAKNSYDHYQMHSKDDSDDDGDIFEEK